MRPFLFDKDMMPGDKGRRSHAGALALCLLLSLLFHLLIAWVLLTLPQGNKKATGTFPRPSTRLIQVSRAHPAAAARPRQEEKQQEKRPFAKTDPDRKEQRPEKADFEGKRDSRASADERNIPPRQSDAPVPTQQGEERDELNTLEQDRQEGPLEYDGKQQEQQVPAASAPGIPQPSPPDKPDDGTAPETRPETAKTQATPEPPQKDGDMKQTPLTLQREPEDFKLSAPPAGWDKQDSRIRRQTQKRPIAYDPSLADHAQPGFRTRERRTRSTGRFVLGRHASLNVEATPRGQYEELIYRRIAYYWYIACDDHRGDIIPGSLTIALRLNTQGHIVNMSLVNRHGASVIQQSFTFGAIRKASLPPMPEAVRKDLVGNLMELLFTFNFD